MTEPLPNDRLNALVQACVEQWDSTGGQIVEEVCQANPDLATALRRRLSLLHRRGLLEEQSDLQALGDFALGEQLGAGGMGVVYRAEQRSLRREVAVKVMRPELSFHPDARQRFVREVGAIARLHHDGIVPVYMAGEERGVLYYAMELVPGCTLAAALQRLQGRDPSQLTGADLAAVVAALQSDGQGTPVVHAADSPLRPDVSWVECALRIARRVALALEHAHARGVLHRDVKPSNVMLTPEGRVLLLDFGLASTDSDARITRSGAQLGSLAYMAPEQVRGEVDVITARTDVYGTGLLLREILTLAQPFLQSNSEATRQAVLGGRLAPMRGVNKAVSNDVELVVGKAMDLEPERRYAGAAELARDLANVLELRPIEARAPGPWLRVRRAAQRHPARALSLGFAAVLLLGVFPVLYFVQRAANERVTVALTATQSALARAATSEAWARQSFAQAREAVDRFLVDIGQFRAADIPLLEDLRRDTLQQAVNLYEALLRDPAAERDPRLARDRDRARFSLAQVLRDLGRGAEAEPLLREVLAACADQNDAATRWLRASASTALAGVLLSGPTERDVSTWLASASADLTALLARAPSMSSAVPQDAAVNPGGAVAHEAAATHPGVREVAVRALLLRNTVQRASLALQRKDQAEAERLFRSALALDDDQAADLETLRTRADAHRGLGNLLAGQSQSGPAAAELRNQIEIRRRVLQRAPGSARLRSEFAAALASLGEHIQAWHADRLVEAADVLDEAGVVYAGLVRDFPQQASYQVQHCRNRISSGSLRGRLGQGEVAERDLRAAVDGVERLRVELPKENGWRPMLGFARHMLAMQWRRDGRHQEADAEFGRARAAVEQLLSETPGDQSLQQQRAEVVLASSESPALEAAAAMALAREAYTLGRAFLPEFRHDARLYGTAFRCFSRLVDLLLADSDVDGALACAADYESAEPYKWLCQLTLARTYLRARGLMTDATDGRRERCLAAAKSCVQKASQHVLQAVARIATDPTFAPLLADPEVAELVRRAGGG